MANQVQWTDAMQMEIVFQFIPEKIDWNGLKLPDGCTIPAAKAMLHRLRKKHGMAKTHSGNLTSSPATPARGKPGPKPRGKKAAPKPGGDEDDEFDAPAPKTPKRKRAPPKKSKEIVEEDDEDDVDELESPTKRVKSEPEDEEEVAVNDSGKEGKESEKEGNGSDPFQDDAVF